MIDTSNIASKLGKGAESRAGWPWRLMFFGIFLSASVAAIYVGLTVGYITYANAEIRNIDNRIAQLSQDIDPETQSRFLDFYSQISGIQKLLGSHVKTTRLFAALETNTNTRVRYTIARIDAFRSQVTLNGAAATYGHLAQQLEAFAVNPDVTNIELIESQTSEGGVVTFSARLTFKPSFIR
ncbi:MAG: hypothetical protein UX23_C0013G0016 [Parcubacteria group bacterium GW2011_GWB1_45_9]|nr:MAG: hypothetical protein UX23_C0013G0016 [Parcubacteria group bacterium GW2011_GWB1_45_9]